MLSFRKCLYINKSKLFLYVDFSNLPPYKTRIMYQLYHEPRQQRLLMLLLYNLAFGRFRFGMTNASAKDIHSILV